MTGRGPRLRGHHLICLQFFGGQGYSGAFVANLFTVIRRLTEEGGTVVAGPDDVCSACPSLEDGVCTHGDDGEAGIRVIDTLALELLELECGDRFDYGETSARLPRILGRWRALACDGCDWQTQCDSLIERSLRYPTGT